MRKHAGSQHTPGIVRHGAFQPITSISTESRVNENAVGRTRATHGILAYRLTNTEVDMTEERLGIADVTWMV